MKPRWGFYLSMKNSAQLDSTLVTCCFPKLNSCVGLLPKHEKQCPHMDHIGWHFVLVIFYRSHQFLMREISFSLGSLGEHIEGSWLDFIFFQLQASWPSTPSSHEMRNNPFLGQYTWISQKVRRWGDEVWKVTSMFRNCYNPKLHHTCIPDIMASYLLFLPSHHWASLLKKPHFWRCTCLAPLLPAYTCLLHHYNSHAYASWTIIARIYSKKL